MTVHLRISNKGGIRSFCLGIIVLFFNACYYDNEVDLYGETECMTIDVRYSELVEPLFRQQCYACHSAAVNSGGVTLEGYNATKTYVDNGRLIGALRHESGFSPMPQNAPMLQACDLDQIEAWISDGALNN